jgi:Calcineurin-like phosphoesterase
MWRAALLALLVACEHDAPVTPADAWVPLDAPPNDGAGKGGGYLGELRFAIVGDTRPANLDDTGNYPTDVVAQIWRDVEAEAPHPAFAVTTGDYMFASTGGNEQGPQLDLYLGARMTFNGIVYPAMGNHECNGYTKSNCGPNSDDGEPRNYTVFLDRMITPIGELAPYFVERFAAVDHSWTAKFVFIAANAWNATQAAWLDLVLTEPTTYTFVVRHEPHDSNTAPGVDPSQQTLAKHPLTMLLTGHSHTYRHVPAYREIIVGNGGAPLTSALNYGYAIVARQPDGSIQVTSREYMTHTIVEQFAVMPDGTLVP